MNPFELTIFRHFLENESRFHSQVHRSLLLFSGDAHTSTLSQAKYESERALFLDTVLIYFIQQFLLAEKRSERYRQRPIRCEKPVSMGVTVSPKFERYPVMCQNCKILLCKS
eukprot:gene22689-28839_t